MASEDWVEGETAPRDFQLLAGGEPQPLSGLTVTLILTKRDGTLVDTASDVSVVDADAGTVRYTPDPTDIAVASSPLAARWKVQSGSAIKFFPKARPDQWNVYRP
jgi:hypothetical protein